MRTKLTNLILHTTSLINERKNRLSITHAFASIANAVVIIFLEIFLIIISIPLYSIYAVLQKNNKTRYWITRVIFSAILFTILIITIELILYIL